MDSNWSKRVTIFLAGQTTSLFGSAIVQFAISWHITLTTKSGLMMTIATVCGFLPQLLISLFAGVWADRFDRKKIIIATDAVIAASTAVLAILFMLGFKEIWLLFIISSIRSFGAGIQTPTVSAFLPDLVPQEKLMQVNGIYSSIQGIMMLLSPVAAGGLYAAVGLEAVFWVDVLTAIIAICLLLSLKVAPSIHTDKNRPKSFIDDMLVGVRYVGREKWLRQLLSFFVLYAFLMGPVVFLTPLMVARSFGEEPWRLVVHEMVFAGGSILGGILVGFVGVRFKNKIQMLLLSSMFFGITIFIMGFSPNFIFYLVIMLPMGLVMPFTNTAAMTVLQTKVNPELMGRVFGLVSIIISGSMPLSMLVFGPLADVVAVEIQLIITGLLMSGASLFAFRLKEMLTAGICPQE